MCGKRAGPLEKNRRDWLPANVTSPSSGSSAGQPGTAFFSEPLPVLSQHTTARRCGGKDGSSHWSIHKRLFGHLLP